MKSVSYTHLDVYKRQSLFLDRKEYAGDLFSQLEQAEAFIKNHINLRGEIKGLQRTDTYELPEAALREALTNALIHRDYTNQGRDIKVGIYDDIVNIVSPGGFPSTLTADGLREGRSEIRNRVIARAVSYTHLDVYKRQSDWRRTRADRLDLCPFLNVRWSAACLLYTSRCV